MSNDLKEIKKMAFPLKVEVNIDFETVESL
jgi:hypothetical protein